MHTDWQAIIKDFKSIVPALEFRSLRLLHDETETLNVRGGLKEACAQVQQ